MKNYIPWIEKYKPKSLETYKTDNIQLQKYINNLDNFKHCILYGKPGSGKTSFIEMIINNLYEKEDIPFCTLSLNASDERGINTVRDKIKIFSKTKMYKKYKFKIIILDEADSLTYEAQTALRRIIELYSKTTRFCFICNYSDKIIKPIKSRCNLIKFNNFSDKYIKNYINDILKKENLYNYKKFVNVVVKLSNNDMRKTLIYMETLVKINHNLINDNLIYNIFGIIKKENFKKELSKIKSYDDILKNINYFLNLSLKQIIDFFTDIIIENNNINSNNKYNFLILLSDIDHLKNKKMNYNLIIHKILKEYIELY